MKYLPDNLEILTIAAWNAGKQKKIDDQIYFLDKILSLEENNSEVLEELSNVYRDQAMYEEQVNVLDIWLKYEPASKKAKPEKKAAYFALGKDETDVDKDRWLSNPSNILLLKLFDPINNFLFEFLTYSKAPLTVVNSLE